MRSVLSQDTQIIVYRAKNKDKDHMGLDEELTNGSSGEELSGRRYVPPLIIARSLRSADDIEQKDSKILSQRFFYHNTVT